ncbi:MAG: hypothetical protein JWO59_603, partial [Chloroflexi bacterium]|nr:hypothetical protein [Chloroflexota bacterium]
MYHCLFAFENQTVGLAHALNVREQYVNAD